MSVRVDVAPEMLTWAIERSRQAPVVVEARVPQLPLWLAGEASPTLKQLEKFARTTHAPVGCLLLSNPPDEELPVPDFRTFADIEVTDPSPDLLETIYLCEQRQEWFRGFARANGDDAVDFVGSLTTDTDIERAAATIRDEIDFRLDERGEFSNWSQALAGLRDRAEAAGVLVMVSGVVGSNTHRRLDPREFRGFALVDDVAPLIFVNGADTKAAQIFTIAHELAHVWLGQSALSNASLRTSASNHVERWCDRVAAELLVPLESFRREYRPSADLNDELERLARFYKVSTLVVLRRVADSGEMTRDDYLAAFDAELDRVIELMRKSRSARGGDFYNTQPVRVSKRFVRAVVIDTLEGRTLHRDAFRMLGFKKQKTFDEMSRRLGVA
jgi:Zn-dependent peptidase ImmA (M78 family)